VQPVDKLVWSPDTGSFIRLYAIISKKAFRDVIILEINKIQPSSLTAGSWHVSQPPSRTPGPGLSRGIEGSA